VDPGFRDAVEQFLVEERRAIAAELDWLRRALPYRMSSSA
jgi:predicted N-acyltransferase